MWEGPTEWLVVPYTEMKETGKGLVWMGENWEFNFGHSKFEVNFRYPKGYVRQAAGYISLELKGERAPLLLDIQICKASL